MWRYLLCFRLNVCTFVLLKCLHHMAPSQPHCYICPLLACRTNICYEADLALLLLCESESMFHPMLDCVVFSLAPLIPRCNVFVLLLLIIVNSCHLLYNNHTSNGMATQQLMSFIQMDIIFLKSEISYVLNKRYYMIIQLHPKKMQRWDNTKIAMSLCFYLTE